MATSYYIYYRVAASDGERLQAIVTRMHAELEASTGIAGRLLRRCDDAQTWMEIYEGVHDIAQFEDALADGVTHHKLEALLQSTRVVERFVPVDPIDPGPAHAPGKTVR